MNKINKLTSTTVVKHYKLEPNQSTRYLTDNELTSRLEWNMQASEDLESAEII